MYLLIHMVPAKLYHYLLEPNPVLVFYFVRCLLSVGCALSEVYFYKYVSVELYYGLINNKYHIKIIIIFYHFSLIEMYAENLGFI